MPAPTTSREALLQCIELWTEIANREVDSIIGKEFLSIELFDYDPLFGCPCCEYASAKTGTTGAGLCGACPVDAWRGLDRGCLVDKTSYEKWDCPSSPQDAKEGALAVAHLAQESLDALEETKEST